MPCYYCPAHCASRKALQAHVKEAHSVVKPDNVKDEEESSTIDDKASQSQVKHIYPCRPCNKKFEDLAALNHHQQHEHFECDNCYKFFSYENLESHKIDKGCTIPCKICGDKPLVMFASGESYVDHMNEKHRSIVGVNWFQCVHCLKLNKRYFNRYYPTKRSLQLHMASVHGQQNSRVERVIVTTTENNLSNEIVKNELSTTLSEIYVPLNQLTMPVTTTQVADEGQQIIQQFQIQLPDQNQFEGQQTQQIQIIQTDPNQPDQPQYITLYTWGAPTNS